MSPHDKQPIPDPKMGGTADRKYPRKPSPKNTYKDREGSLTTATSQWNEAGQQGMPRQKNRGNMTPGGVKMGGRYIDPNIYAGPPGFNTQITGGSTPGEAPPEDGGHSLLGPRTPTGKSATPQATDLRPTAPRPWNETFQPGAPPTASGPTGTYIPGRGTPSSLPPGPTSTYTPPIAPVTGAGQLPLPTSPSSQWPQAAQTATQPTTPGGNPMAPPGSYPQRYSSNPPPPSPTQPGPWQQAGGKAKSLLQNVGSQLHATDANGNPSGPLAWGAAVGRYAVRPSPMNFDTAMNKRWSPESKALVYGRGRAEPSTINIRTNQHFGAHDPSAMGGRGKPGEGRGAIPAHDDNSPGWTPYGRGLTGADLQGEPDFYSHHQPPGGPPQFAGGAPLSRRMAPPGNPDDYLNRGALAAPGSNMWLDQHEQVINNGSWLDPHTELTSGANRQPIQGIHAPQP